MESTSVLSPQTTFRGVAGRLLSAVVTGRGARIAMLVIFVVGVLIPIVFMATTSVKEPIEIRLSGALFPSKTIYITNWFNAYANVPLFKYLMNSTIVAVVSTLISLAVAVPVTYAIVRFQIGGRILPAMILGTYVMPPIVVSVAIFAMMRVVGLTDSLLGLLIVHAMANLPVAVWLLDGFVRNIPKELEHAAWVDGYGRWATLFKVVVPLIKSGIVATGIIILILSWNEFLFALILTYSDAYHTFPIGISRYEGQHGLQFGEMSAAALTGIIPIYVLVLFFQRYLVEGLTHGGVKG